MYHRKLILKRLHVDGAPISSRHQHNQTITSKFIAMVQAAEPLNLDQPVLVVKILSKNEQYFPQLPPRLLRKS
jgi:hypothetical protein